MLRIEVAKNMNAMFPNLNYECGLIYQGKKMSNFVNK
jgi:hypothetical protein